MAAAIWLGRIQRKILWPVLGTDEFPELRLIDESTRIGFSEAISHGLIPTAASDARRLAVPNLTAGTYLRYARVCYEGAFGKAVHRTDVELYRAYSDGRHGGLVDLPPQNPEAFLRWYENDAFRGAHPFEIVRDQTVLFPHRLPAPPRDYFLRLANRRRDRVEPYLVPMAVELHAAGIPFYMENGDAHAEFARGDDWIAVTTDEAWDQGCPRLPDGLGFLNAPQNSVLRSQLEPFADILRQVQWLDGIPIEYEHVYESTQQRSVTS